MEVDLIKTMIFYIENPTNSYAILTIGILLLAIEFSTPGGFILGLVGSIVTAYAFWLLGFYWALVLSLLAFFSVVYLGIEAMRLKKKIGKETLIGKIATIKEPLNPRGKIYFDGELWSAEMEDKSIVTDGEVEIVSKNGFILTVQKRSSR